MSKNFQNTLFIVENLEAVTLLVILRPFHIRLKKGLYQCKCLLSIKEVARNHNRQIHSQTGPSQNKLSRSFSTDIAIGFVIKRVASKTLMAIS
jgi:hypothetical protein